MTTVETIHLFQSDRHVTRKVLIQIHLITIMLWVTHTLQIVLFFFMIELKLPIIMISTYMLCAVFVGLVPISFAGVGTRDLTIVYLFHGFIAYGEALTIGMLCTMRYAVSALIGLPFFIQLSFFRRYHEGNHNSPAKKQY